MENREGCSGLHRKEGEVKRVPLLILLCGFLCGCWPPSHPANAPQQPVQAEPAKAPCAPNVTQESKGVVRPTITEKNTHNASWGETHEADCPRNMRTVIPSSREISAAEGGDIVRWIDEHEYCIPDGGKP